MRQVCNHPTLITDLDATAENSRLMDGKSSDAVSEYNRAIKALGPNWVAKMVAKVQGLAVEKMETELQVSTATATILTLYLLLFLVC